jgi:methylthioribose-1-phosphate isomerase
LRSIDWVDGALELVDQTLLPGELVRLSVNDVPTLVDCIKRLAVRGAPAIGVAGAFGVAIAVRNHARVPSSMQPSRRCATPGPPP